MHAGLYLSVIESMCPLESLLRYPNGPLIVTVHVVKIPDFGLRDVSQICLDFLLLAEEPAKW